MSYIIFGNVYKSYLEERLKLTDETRKCFWVKDLMCWSTKCLTTDWHNRISEKARVDTFAWLIDMLVDNGAEEMGMFSGSKWLLYTSTSYKLPHFNWSVHTYFSLLCCAPPYSDHMWLKHVVNKWEKQKTTVLVSVC